MTVHLDVGVSPHAPGIMGQTDAGRIAMLLDDFNTLV